MTIGLVIFRPVHWSSALKALLFELLKSALSFLCEHGLVQSREVRHVPKSSDIRSDAATRCFAFTRSCFAGTSSERRQTTPCDCRAQPVRPLWKVRQTVIPAFSFVLSFCYPVAPSGTCFQVPGFRENKMTKMAGFTIIQLMLVLLVAGLAGSFLVDALIDKRCESDPSSSLCTSKAKPSAS